MLGRSAVGEKFSERSRRVPAGEPRCRPDRLAADLAASFLQRSPQDELKLAERIPGRLDPGQEAVEGRDVAADRVRTEDIRLDERRSGSHKRVVDARAGREVPVEEDLDQLRNELAEVRVETVDMFRPLDLRKLILGPRQLEVDFSVKSILCPSGHEA